MSSKDGNEVTLQNRAQHSMQLLRICSVDPDLIQSHVQNALLSLIPRESSSRNAGGLRQEICEDSRAHLALLLAPLKGLSVLSNSTPNLPQYINFFHEGGASIVKSPVTSIPSYLQVLKPKPADNTADDTTNSHTATYPAETEDTDAEMTAEIDEEEKKTSMIENFLKSAQEAES